METTYKLSEFEAMIVKELYNAPLISRNIHYLTVKLNSSQSTLYNKIKVLEILGYLKPHKNKRAIFYNITEEGFAKAVERLQELKRQQLESELSRLPKEPELQPEVIG